MVLAIDVLLKSHYCPNLQFPMMFGDNWLQPNPAYTGPTLPVSMETHAEKHRQEGETFFQAMERLAIRLGESDRHKLDLFDGLCDQRIIFGGRIQAAIGSRRRVTAFNCYVSDTIRDSLVDGHGSIMQTAFDAAKTLSMGGGIGFDFSTLRPRNAVISGLGSTSSGAVSFMAIFNAVAKTIKSAGHRRAAMMGVLRVDHPDIEEFIRAKRNADYLSDFNISVGITDEFMHAVLSDSSFDLRHGGKVYKTIRAVDLWEQIMQSTWDWAEPGVLFLDTINRMNNLYYCEWLAASNPCGEQPLPPDGACNLGALNLVKYVYRTNEGWFFNWDKFRDDIHVAHRALDRVIDLAIYPHEAQKREAIAKRRVGLGILGLANALELMGLRYGSPEFCALTEKICKMLVHESYWSSVQLAIEKGPFPLFDREKYCKSAFIQTLDPLLQRAIWENGVRNSHNNTCAPTGTGALTADNVSSGCEPPFSLEYDRLIYKSTGEQVTERVTDWLWRVHGIRGKTSQEISVDEHLNVLVAVQKYMDSAVSKTCNCGSGVKYDEFKDVYVQAWKRGAKGCTTFRPDGKRMGILKDAEEKLEINPPPEESGACKWDPVTGIRSCE